MMSYTASAAWSHRVSSPYYTEHDQRYDVIISGRITTVTMSKSDQLSLRCSVESNCSGKARWQPGLHYQTTCSGACHDLL
jgi:hypothetical protein